MNGAPLLTNEASRSDEELLTNVVTTRRRRDHSAIISALSNLSIQYNFQAIAIALAFMDGPAHIYPASPADLSLLQSLVFARERSRIQCRCIDDVQRVCESRRLSSRRDSMHCMQSGQVFDSIERGSLHRVR